MLDYIHRCKFYAARRSRPDTPRKLRPNKKGIGATLAAVPSSLAVREGFEPSIRY